MSFASAVRIARVGGEVERPARRPSLRRGAEVGDDVHRVGRRAAVAEREQRAARVERPRSARRRPRARGCASASVCARSARDLVGLQQHRARDVGDDRVEVAARLLLEERIEETGRARAGRRAPQVVEEDVHELPEHVVERLDELLAHERVVATAVEAPLAPPPDASPAAGSNEITASRGPAQQRAARPARQRERRQGALADDHRVDELHRDVARVRPRLRRPADREQPAAATKRSASSRQSARDPLRLRREEAAVRVVRARQRVASSTLRRRGARRVAPAPARAIAAASRATRPRPRRSAR